MYIYVLLLIELRYFETEGWGGGGVAAIWRWSGVEEKVAAGG